MGVESTSSAWEADVLPLNYTRTQGLSSKAIWRNYATERL
jgi:hypothetical protein